MQKKYCSWQSAIPIYNFTNNRVFQCYNENFNVHKQTMQDILIIIYFEKVGRDANKKNVKIKTIRVFKISYWSSYLFPKLSSEAAPLPGGLKKSATIPGVKPVKANV